jgi:hypothetical protein
MEMLSGSNVNADVYAFARGTTQALISVYAMRMAAVFSTLALRTLRHLPLGLSPRMPGRGRAPARIRRAHMDPVLVPTWVLLLTIVILSTRPPVR